MRLGRCRIATSRTTNNPGETSGCLGFGPGRGTEPLASDRALSAQDYSRLLAARSALAGFARRGEERARLQGLTHVQHHLLLAVHAHPDGKPGVVDVAAHLAVRPNSSAELVDRAVAGGYLERPRHESNRRRVQLRHPSRRRTTRQPQP